MGGYLSQGIFSFKRNSSKRPYLPEDKDRDSSSTTTTTTTATATAANLESKQSTSLLLNTSNQEQSIKSHIHWDVKFYKDKATPFTTLSLLEREREQEREREREREREGKRAETKQEAVESRLRWHLFSLLLLEIMKRGDGVPPQSMDEAAVRDYLGPQFVQAQFDAAKSEGGLITKDQICSYLPIPQMCDETSSQTTDQSSDKTDKTAENSSKNSRYVYNINI